MHLPRLFLLLAVSLALNGCADYTNYTKVRSTNLRGELISEWVAHGPIWRSDGGYRITAVECRTAPPYPTFTKYPEGWHTTVVGPHIVHWRTPKPRWLEEHDYR